MTLGPVRHYFKVTIFRFKSISNKISTVWHNIWHIEQHSRTCHVYINSKIITFNNINSHRLARGSGNKYYKTVIFEFDSNNKFIYTFFIIFCRYSHNFNHPLWKT